MNRSKDTGGLSASMRRPDVYLWPKSVRVGGGADDPGRDKSKGRSRDDDDFGL
jgi:hypothetical protein